MSRLDSHVSAVQRRMALATFFEWLGISLFVLASAALLVILVDKLVHFSVPRVTLWVGAGAALAVAAGVAFVRRPSFESAAVAIDQRLSLKEKFSTALHARRMTDPFSQAVVRDAEQTAAAVTLSGKFPVAFPRTAAWAIAAAALAFGATFLPKYDLMHRKEKELARQVEESQRKEAEKTVRDALVKLEALPPAVGNTEQIKIVKADLEAMLKRGDMTPDAMGRRVIEAKDQVKEGLKAALKENEKYQVAKSFESMMKSNLPPHDMKGPVADAQRALAKGDFKEAADDLKRAVDEFNNKTPEEQKKVAEQVAQLAQQLQNAANNPQQQQQIQQQLQNQLQQQMQQAGMNQQQAQQAAQQMAQQAQQAAQGNPQAQQQMQQAMQQAAQQLAQNNPQAAQQMAQAMQQAAQAAQQQMQQQAGAQASAQQMAQAAQQMAQAMQNAQQGQPGQQGQQAQQQMQQGQQAMQDALGQLEAAQQDMQQMAAAQQGMKDAADQAAGQCNNPGQGQGQGAGEPKPSGNKGEWAQGDPAGNKGGGQGGPGIGAGGGGDKSASPFAVKQEVSKSFYDAKGQHLASTLVRDGTIKGEAKSTIQELAKAGEANEGDDVDDSRPDRRSQEVQRKYFRTMAEAANKGGN